MKKLINSFLVLISTFSIFFLPSATYAIQIPFISNIAQYSLGDEQSLYLGAFVCKVQVCDINNFDDWYNYSSVSTNVEGDTGAGTTLVVKPGDTLTFLGQVVTNSIAPVDPVFGVNFVGAQYLDNIDFFGTGMSDLDGDDIHYGFNEGTGEIGFSGLLGGEATSPQFGSITAKIVDDVPDQTVITAEFYFDGAKAQTRNPFVRSAHADDLAGSTVRILVSNPLVAANAVQVLPKTGTHNPGWLEQIIAYALLVTPVFLIGYYTLRKNKTAKN